MDQVEDWGSEPQSDLVAFLATFVENGLPLIVLYGEIARLDLRLLTRHLLPDLHHTLRKNITRGQSVNQPFSNQIMHVS